MTRFMVTVLLAFSAPFAHATCVENLTDSFYDFARFIRDDGFELGLHLGEALPDVRQSHFLSVDVDSRHKVILMMSGSHHDGGAAPVIITGVESGHVARTVPELETTAHGRLRKLLETYPEMNPEIVDSERLGLVYYRLQPRPGRTGELSALIREVQRWKAR